MPHRPGVPPSTVPHPRRHRAAAALVRRTAARLRTGPPDADTRALAALLDLLAAELPHVSPAVRRTTLAACAPEVIRRCRRCAGRRPGR